MPGTKKSLKGDRSKIDRGKPPNNFPEGEIIKAIIPFYTQSKCGKLFGSLE